MKREPQAKPTPGHKCSGVYLSVGCDGGWMSPRARGRADAYTEWRYHVERHRKVAAGGEIPCACYGHKGQDGSYVHERGCPVKAQMDREAYVRALKGQS